MTFSPVLAASGTLGWSFLKRTAATQQAALANTPEAKRDAAYFRAKIGTIDSADQLVADRRLLRISLEAFGLESDLDSRAFIAKILSEGTLKQGAFALRLTDPRYKALTEAFGFGDFAVPNTKLSDFPDRLLAQWQERRFEAAVGQQNDGLRLALNAKRELASLAASPASDTTRWLRLIANPPLRKVVQQALNLPASIATLDIDRQVAIFREKAASAFGSGSFAQLAAPPTTEALIQRFLVRSEISASQSQPAALAMLAQTRSFLRRL